MSKQQLPKDLSALTIIDRNNYMHQLGKSNGFLQVYLNSLGQFPTQIETFNHLNDLYFELWGEYRFSDYNSFRWSLRKYLKN